MDQSRVRNAKYRKRVDRSAAPDGKKDSEGTAADRPSPQTQRKAASSGFQRTSGQAPSPPPPPARDPKWSRAALGATYPQPGPLSRYITRPRALLLPSVRSRETAVSPRSLPATGERAWAPSAPARTREPSGKTRRRAAGRGGGRREGGGGRVRPGTPRSPAARSRSAPFGPALGAPLGPLPAGSPLPQPRPLPRTPGVRPSPRPTARSPEVLARYLVRHGDGGFPGGLRTAAASGRLNLTLRFTNLSLPHSTTPRLQGLPLRLASLPLRADERLGRREKEAGKGLGEGRGPSDLQICLSGARDLGVRPAGEPGPLPQPLGTPELRHPRLNVRGQTDAVDSSLSDTLRA